MEVRVLGPVELVEGDAVIRLAPAERTLLGALASRAGERVAADVLEEALWPVDLPPTARKSLQGHVARLRRTLGADAVVQQSGGYRLDADRIEIDAGRVSRLLDEARSAIGQQRPEDAASMLREANASFRGEPYADVPESALPAGEVQRLLELRATVAEESFDAELTAGGGARCVGPLEAWLEANPLRERGWGQLMRALYQAGRPADALAAYGRARIVLARELGLEPGPALRELERAILTHDRRLGSAADELGSSNLPASLNPIVGRESELAALARMCDDNRLVTLTGTGGIGKTRLAVELADRMTGRHDHGPYFVDLVPITDVDQVAPAVAAALSVDIEAHEDVIGRIQAALGGRPVMMVVDNCEHLLPGVAELVGGLLAGNPSVRVVATSREPLDIPGERVWPLSPLGVPPPTASRAEVERSESGALFLARLPMNVASRAMSADDIGAVVSVCRSVDGIPLGLELAAARSRTLSLSDLASRLGDSIRDLAQPGHGVEPRHRTMHAALDWGTRMLSPPARAALRAMSVVAGGCEPDAFAAVCLDEDGPPADAVIDELVRTSFVIVDFDMQPPRYRMLEPVRQYSAAQLDDAGERGERQQRHLHFYVDLAHTLSDPMIEQPIELFERELGNFRVALDWATGTTERTDAGLRLVADLYPLWTRAGHQREGVDRTVVLLRSGGGSRDARSRAARTGGIIAANLGDSELGKALCEQALDEALAGASDPLFEGRARQVLAHAYAEAGDIPAARQQLDAAMRLHTDRTEEGLREFCLVSKAIVDAMTAEFDGATEASEQVLESSFGSLGWTGPAARSILGSIMFERGDTDRARSWLTDAIALAESLGDHGDALLGHLDLVVIECAAGRLDAAEAQFAAALELSPETDRGGDLELLVARAELALYGGEPTRAGELAEVALARAGEMDRAHDRCRCLRRLGDAQLEAGDADRALTTFRMLVARARAAPYPCREAEGHEGAAAAAAALGRRRIAHRHVAAAAEIRDRVGSRRVGRPWLERHLAALEAKAQQRQLSESGR